LTVELGIKITVFFLMKTDVIPTQEGT